MSITAGPTGCQTFVLLILLAAVTAVYAHYAALRAATTSLMRGGAVPTNGVDSRRLPDNSVAGAKTPPMPGDMMARRAAWFCASYADTTGRTHNDANQAPLDPVASRRLSHAESHSRPTCRSTSSRIAAWDRFEPSGWSWVSRSIVGFQIQLA